MPFSIFHDPFAFLFPVHQEKFGAVSDANAATAATAASAANAASAAIAAIGAIAAALKFGPGALQSNHIYHQNKGIFFHHFVKLRSNDSEISERNRFFPEMQLQGQRLFPPCEKNLDDGSLLQTTSKISLGNFVILYCSANALFYVLVLRNTRLGGGGCVAQMKHSCFPPSSPWFQPRLR